MHEHMRIRLVQDERDREVAAQVVREVFGAVPGKRLGTDRTSISRAMNGSDCNPLNRLRRWARRAAINGVPREVAELLVADVRAAISAAYGDHDICYREALRLEHEADLAEDRPQLAAFEDPAHLPEWLAGAKRYRAILDVAIAAGERAVVEHTAMAGAA